jgi:hypothetical protein
VCYKISIISHPHKEMLMRKSPPHHRSVQLTLFHPPQAQPAWRLFPIAVQQVATKLLAQLLYQAHRGYRGSTGAQEVDDD